MGGWRAWPGAIRLRRHQAIFSVNPEVTASDQGEGVPGDRGDVLAASSAPGNCSSAVTRCRVVGHRSEDDARQRHKSAPVRST